ncbi:hypothetical protein EIK77_003098 [Talaromyces pinophilus]|nr:hypothetical protein EIK77_003098 [Talaromyces pinophilus]
MPRVDSRRPTFPAYPVKAYLIVKYLKEVAISGRWNAFEADLDNGPFFLKHMDDKDDHHILVDDDYNITGVIGWTFARVVPAFEAFGPLLLTADLDDLLKGKLGRSLGDKILTKALHGKGITDIDLARMMNGPDVVRRFSFGLGMGMDLSSTEADHLFKGIISTATGIPLLQEMDLEVWYDNRLHEWADDSRLQTLLLRETRKYQTCRTPYEALNDEVLELLSQVNSHELVRLATQLNNGIPCIFQPGNHSGVDATMGCANYHCWLIFDTGEKWIVRIPRTGFSDVPSELVEYLVESEYATLKFLESANIPTPKVHGYGLASDPSNRVGVCYIMMQALTGKPYYAHEASTAQKERIIEQVANYLAELSKHPVSSIGSFAMVNNQPEISAVASNRFVALGTYGPFTSSLDYITSIIEQYMDLIADGQLHHKYSLEAFLFYHFLRENKDRLMSDGHPDDNPEQQQQFFIKHVEDKGDHLLIDDDYNVTGIIDWQFVRVVPATEAFGPSYVTADLGSLYSSSTGLSADDRLLAGALRSQGYHDLAAFAEGNEIMHRFHHGLADGISKNEARELLEGMVSCVLGKGVDDLDAWIGEMCIKCRGDPRWEKVEALLREQEAESD